ncbi:MAG: CYTH domain-containing protein [Saprospiraceae bacterium]|nr:CYTH domain-containing protein [Saprospiraceae bacterium]
MSIEIERKFLVHVDDYKKEAIQSTEIKQGYLCTDPQRTVRVRIKGNHAYLTIKGQGNESGMSRFEWEKEIPVDEANQLLKLSLPGMIDKIRYEVISGNHTIEVDEFLGDNQGLTVAEIELKNENESILLPDWIGMEVTGDQRYYNAQLMLVPYNTW